MPLVSNAAGDDVVATDETDEFIGNLIRDVVDSVVGSEETSNIEA